MTSEDMYELLHQVLEPFNRGLDLERKFALDGLLDVASRKLAEEWKKKACLSVCSYCGKISDAGSPDWDAKRKVAMDHILECEKRPELQLIDHGIKLLNALRSVCDWEEEYRTINNLGSKAPAPFDAAREFLNV
jgi:hypothetical protein